MTCDCKFPPFDEAASDGCSGGVRQIARGCCVEHDRAYWEGRTLLDKWRADLGLARCIWRYGYDKVTREVDPSPYPTIVAWWVLGVVRGLAVALFAWHPFFGKPHKRRCACKR